MLMVVTERFEHMIAECDLIFERFHRMVPHGFTSNAIQAMIHSGSYGSTCRKKTIRRLAYSSAAKANKTNQP
jgi:hypothetical protein